jgi:hypothetical protein
MPPVEIDKDKAIALLEECVTERGEAYSYTKEFGEDVCKYVKDGKPACLIGLALTKVGVPINYLESFDSGLMTVKTVFESERQEDWLNIHDYVTIDLEGLHVLSRAQTLQDFGYTWGIALERAREV